MSSLEKGEDLKRISINSAYSPTASVTIDIPVTTIVPNKRKTSPIAVSPSGSYVALFDDGKDSISVWMMSKNGLEPVSEVNVNSSTNYQGFAISDYGYLASGHGKLFICCVSQCLIAQDCFYCNIISNLLGD